MWLGVWGGERSTGAEGGPVAGRVGVDVSKSPFLGTSTLSLLLSLQPEQQRPLGRATGGWLMGQFLGRTSIPLVPNLPRHISSSASPSLPGLFLLLLPASLTTPCAWNRSGQKKLSWQYSDFYQRWLLILMAADIPLV